MLGSNQISSKGDTNKVFIKNEYTREIPDEPTFEQSTEWFDDKFNMVETTPTQILTQNSVETLAAFKEEPEIASCISDIFVCGVCMKQFLFPNPVQRHMLELHMTERHSFKCTCDDTTSYDSIDDLLFHKKQYAILSFTKCDYCHIYFTTLEDLEQHRAMKRHYCNKCQTSFGKCALLNEHWLHLNTIGPFKCDDCDFKTESCYILKSHAKLCIKKLKIAAHKKGKPVHACLLCQKVYRRPYQLREHRRLYHGIIYECKYCKATFDLESLWRSHKCAEMEHELNMEKDRSRNQVEEGEIAMEASTRMKRMYQCNFCMKMFVRLFKLRDHMSRTHFVDINNKKDMLSCSKRINVLSIKSVKSKMRNMYLGGDKKLVEVRFENDDKTPENNHDSTTSIEFQMDEETRAATASLMFLEGL